MTIFLDADVIIGGEKQRFDLQQWLSKNSTESFALAATTVAELWHGVERATNEKQRKLRRSYLDSLFTVLPIIPYSHSTAIVHARLWAMLDKRGEMIGYYDLILSAAAVEHDCAIATFNEKHFARIPNLKVFVPK